MTDSSSTHEGTVIGDKGEAWFFYALPDGWIWQPPRRDVGKDGLIVIRDRSELHNLEFSVQIKTSGKPKVHDGHVVIRGVSRSSVQYWFASPLPTLVVAVDLSTRTARYGWHLELFDSPEQVFGTDTPKVSIRIPEKNRLDGSGWNAIRTYLLQHFRALQRALTTDTVAPHVMATLHNISRITGNLIRLGATAPPEPPLTRSEGMAILIEQIELRDLMDTVRALLERLAVSSDAHKQVAFWLKSFEHTALDAHPTIRLLPPRGSDIPADLELGFAPKRLLEIRPQLVRAAVDLLRLLTSPRPGSGSEARAG
ncbi:MAG: DUF4365 domain-containing protein [Methylococcales bacterium]